MGRRAPAQITSTLKGLLIALNQGAQGILQVRSDGTFTKVAFAAVITYFPLVTAQLIWLDAHTVSGGDRCLGKIAQSPLGFERRGFLWFDA